MISQERSNLIVARNTLSECYDLRKLGEHNLARLKVIGEQIDIIDHRIAKIDESAPTGVIESIIVKIHRENRSGMQPQKVPAV